MGILLAKKEKKNCNLHCYCLFGWDDYKERWKMMERKCKENWCFPLFDQKENRNERKRNSGEMDTSIFMTLLLLVLLLLLFDT